MDEANYNMDFETLLSYSYPKMVEKIGSEKMFESIDKHFENEEYRLRFQLETIPFKFSTIKKSRRYVILYYYV